MKTYYPSSIKNNPYYALATDHSNETASSIIRSILNKQPSLHPDSAATGHFITEDFPGTLITHQPLRVECANSEYMKSSATKLLDLPGLPREARIAHVFPSMVRSLLSIPVLCDAECEVKFMKE